MSTDRGRTFRRRPLGPSFTLADAPLLAGDPSILVPPGLFLGDYTGLVVQRGSVYAAFATANRDTANPTDIRFRCEHPALSRKLRRDQFLAGAAAGAAATGLRPVPAEAP